MNILVTLGATREPIDRVRYISNISSGRTGAALCDRLSALGHRVRALVGVGAVTPTEVRDIAFFTSAVDLDGKLRAALGSDSTEGDRIDVVIHCAAVADFVVRSVTIDGRRYAPEEAGKVASDALPELELQPAPKLLPKLKSYAAPGRAPVVVGFKFTVDAHADARAAAIAKLFAGGAVDLVVHNDLAEMQSGRHIFRVFSRVRQLAQVGSAAALADVLSGNFKS